MLEDEGHIATPVNTGISRNARFMRATFPAGSGCDLSSSGIVSIRPTNWMLVIGGDAARLPKFVGIFCDLVL